MKNIYENMYGVGGVNYNLKDNIRVSVMSSLVQSLRLVRCKVCDIGFGDGTLVETLKNKSFDFYGVDASSYAVENASSKGIRAKQYFFDDISPLPYKDNTFDVVLAGEIIEHIFDTDFFLKEIQRVLKPGGYLVISTPNIASLGRRVYLLFGKSPLVEDTPNRKDSSGHIRYFTFRSLGRLLSENGFFIISSASDVVNFDNRGRLRSRFLAKIFPTIGQSVIMLCQKKK